MINDEDLTQNVSNTKKNFSINKKTIFAAAKMVTKQVFCFVIG